MRRASVTERLPSALRKKEHCHDFRLGPKGNIERPAIDVRFAPKADISMDVGLIKTRRPFFER